MALEPIGPSLRGLLDRLGWSARLKGWEALAIWPEVAGRPAAARSRAVGFDSGRLIVEVDSPVWMAQLAYLRRGICERLNARLGGSVIQDIHFTPSRGRQG